MVIFMCILPHTHKECSGPIYPVMESSLRHHAQKASCRIIQDGLIYVKNHKINRIWISVSVCLHVHLKYLSGHVWGEVQGWGKMVKRDSYFVFSKDLHYILIHYLNFKNWKCVYALLVQLKTKIIKKNRLVSFLRPNIYTTHKQEDPGIQAGVGVSRLLWCQAVSPVVPCSLLSWARMCGLSGSRDEFPKSVFPIHVLRSGQALSLTYTTTCRRDSKQFLATLGISLQYGFMSHQAWKVHLC